MRTIIAVTIVAVIALTPVAVAGSVRQRVVDVITKTERNAVTKRNTIKRERAERRREEVDAANEAIEACRTADDIRERPGDRQKHICGITVTARERRKK